MLAFFEDIVLARDGCQCIADEAKMDKRRAKRVKVRLQCHFLHLFCHPLSLLQERKAEKVTVKQEKKLFSRTEKQPQRFRVESFYAIFAS
jgi:hypothetical protein